MLQCGSPPEQCFGIEHSTIVLQDEKQICALTDLGTAIPLFRYAAVLTLAQSGSHHFDAHRDIDGFLALLENVFLLNLVNPSAPIHRLAPLDPASNCHGWIFAEGQFVIHDSSIPTILAEHGYSEVEQPAAGDIAIYRTNGEIVHSGLVRLANPNNDTLLDSKWGPFSVFLHPPEAHPGIWKFYRTSRATHTLKLAPIAA